MGAARAEEVEDDPEWEPEGFNADGGEDVQALEGMYCCERHFGGFFVVCTLLKLGESVSDAFNTKLKKELVL